MLPTIARTKRFGVPVLGLSLLAAAGVTSCNQMDVDEILGEVRDSGSAPTGTAIPFEEFTDDVGAHAAAQTRVLIRTAQGYQTFFGHAAPAGVDFAKQWVIFYSAGTKPTGGFDANLVSLTLTGSNLVAVTELVSPGGSCAVIQVVTTPSVLVKFPAQAGASIQFYKQDRVQECSACAAVTCPAGSRCEEHQVQCVRAPCPPIASCIPVEPVVHCGGIAGIPCPGAGRCVDDPSDSCDPAAGGADCGGICTCIQNVACVAGSKFDNTPSVCACVPRDPPPPDDPCAAIRCSAGTHCESHVVECFAAPCPPIAACVPDAPPAVHCGGIAGIPCPGRGTCVDDPSDSCDPKAGGADCGGICTCVQNVLCVVGAVFDSSPSVCACVTKKPPACGPVCDIFCTYGHVIDGNGCPTCGCNPPPKPPAR